MAFHDDEDDKSKSDTISEDAVGEVLDEDADEDDALVSDPLLEDEKGWE